jgi:hypothetical protein
MNFFKNLFTPSDQRTLAEIVGPLHKNKDYSGMYESEAITLPYWEREKVKVSFTKGDDAAFMKTAEVVLKRFLKLTKADRMQDSKRIYINYQDVLNSGKPAIERLSAQTIWDFVTPIALFIERDINGKYYAVLSCKCEWEKTHGLQLVFKEGKKLTRASGHDGQYQDWN